MCGRDVRERRGRGLDRLARRPPRDGHETGKRGDSGAGQQATAGAGPKAPWGGESRQPAAPAAVSMQPDQHAFHTK